MASPQDCDELGDRGSLGFGQLGEAGLEWAADPEPVELAREPRWWDVPDQLKELDQGDGGRIRGSQQIRWGWPSPGRPARIKERGDVALIATHHQAQGAHRAAETLEDRSEAIAE
jgi:hypothetical protein